MQENNEEDIIEVKHVTDFPSITVSANFETTVSHLENTIVNINTTLSGDTIAKQVQHNIVENTTVGAKIVSNANHHRPVQIDGSNSNEKVNGNNIKNKQESTELPNKLNSMVIESLNTFELTNSNSVTLKTPTNLEPFTSVLETTILRSSDVSLFPTASNKLSNCQKLKSETFLSWGRGKIAGLPDFLNIQTIEACRQECTKRGECVAWNFKLTFGCNLKNKITGEQTFQGWTLGFKGC